MREAKFTIVGIEASLFKFIRILEGLILSQPESYTLSQNRHIQIAILNCALRIKAIYAKDDSQKLDFMLNNLTLGDGSPVDLMQHLLTASGLEENPSPQFEAILKALPAKVAACNDIWFYKDLLGLAKCATEYVKSNKSYTKQSTSSADLKGSTVSSISYRSRNFL